jgi:hypothetical protein
VRWTVKRFGIRIGFDRDLDQCRSVPQPKVRAHACHPSPPPPPASVPARLPSNVDKHEARALLAEQIAELRTRSYEELRRLLSEVETAEVVAPSGTRYQVERQAHLGQQEGGASPSLRAH